MVWGLEEEIKIRPASRTVPQAGEFIFSGFLLCCLPKCPDFEEPLTANFMLWYDL
jgi:hypothetical protein